MRRAWKVRFAGWPPVRRAAAGIDVTHKLRQPGRRCERLPRALAHDGRGDPRSEALFAVDPQNPGELARGVGVEDVGRGLAGGRVHPHVERRVVRVGEAACGVVELQRRDPEIEQHAVDGRQAETRENLGKLVIDGVHQGGARLVGLQPGCGERERVGVAVDADEAGLRVRCQQRLRVTRHAERGVDHDRVRACECGREQFEHPTEQHRHVPVRHLR